MEYGGDDAPGFRIRCVCGARPRCNGAVIQSPASTDAKKPPTYGSVGGSGELSRFNFKLIRVYQHKPHKTRIRAVL